MEGVAVVVVVAAVVCLSQVCNNLRFKHSKARGGGGGGGESSSNIFWRESLFSKMLSRRAGMNGVVGTARP